jgi:LPXTG-site transpeptidase (sortase) family protein
MKRIVKVARKKNSKSRSTPWFPIFLIFIGVLLVSLWGLHKFTYNRALSISEKILSSYTKQKTGTALPIHIGIGTRISLPVVEAGRENGVWAISQTSANHVRQSALPNEKGNIIIYGHNLNKIFGYLMDTKEGDIIRIRMTDGTLHKYKVESTQYVSPSQTALLAPTHEEVLTVYTCAGLFDSLRFVVRAKPTL